MLQITMTEATYCQPPEKAHLEQILRPRSVSYRKMSPWRPVEGNLPR